ncbi:MAG: sugar ABC transporter permease [Clostridia bacterium]|nr:sugar ABC transporter permease [Clostridia bacterium]
MQFDKQAPSLRKTNRMAGLARDWRLYLMLALPIFWYLLFCYKPMVGLIIAFQKYNLFKGMWGSKWVGLENFRFTMQMSDFSYALVNTLWLNLLGLVCGFPVPIILAIMLNEMRSVGTKKVFQTLLYLPHFLSWIIIGGMVLQIFSPTSGIINATLLRWGWIDKSIPFLTDGPHWQATYTLVGVWQGMGWGTILYLSAITGINMELFEAAKIDGANKMQQIWHVTLPGIRSTIVVLLILNIGQMMNISFDRPQILGNAQVRKFCDVLSTFVYRTGIENHKFERATAIGLFQSLVGLILISGANFITKRLGEEGIW